ncbi:MAG: hypothetical protein KC461_04200 [Dehalococcoidia bacterium]|nr:hypothetical protein [Dehalococcoidia bacterium]MCA9849830.1 hypothetical protein [Dehalococcoidia bacterium]MCA9857614.1 hypothetical protein [Dehalococcoidia bacterium]MCB9482852.1 hypothetical protein [Dehalococcoidia bacterium]MCB9492101.1 hypothetical protein [Dehalococcoidia bacterium]
MSAASLPYTLLLLLAELAVGSLVMVVAFDRRGQVTAGYVKAGALTLVPLAIFAMWTFLAISPSADVEGYRLEEAWYRPFGVLFALFLAGSVGHMAFAMAGERKRSIQVGIAGSVAGVVAMVLLGLFVAPPVWNPVLAVLSVLASTAVLGGALMAMMWGHWYLTSGRLPKEPMEQMSLVVLAALLLQVVLVLIGTFTPAREVPLSDGLGVSLGANPAFWLRIGVGLFFPIGVTWLAFRAAQIRGMMSATGLLYIALGAVLAGEVLARGLLFSTGHAV